MSYSYQWQRCNSSGASCAAIAGASAVSYLLGLQDVGSTMRVSVTASNAAGSATASSAATDAVSGLSPSVPTGTTIFQKQWEDGLKVSEGWGAQDSSTVTSTASIQRGTINPDSTTSDRGNIGGRFDLPAYSGGNTAAELLHPRLADPGVNDYYAEAVKFADFNWGNCEQQPLSLAQYNFAGVNGSPLALSGQCGTGYGSSATTLKSLYLLVNSGNCPTSGGCPFFSGTPVGGGYASRGVPDKGPYYFVSPGGVELNVWYELIVHVYWTTGLDGVVEGWVRKQGDASFTKVFSHSGGFPTLQWGGPNGVSAASLSNYGTNDKFGAYRGPNPNPLKLWQDSFCRATSFSAAASCFG